MVKCDGPIQQQFIPYALPPLPHATISPYSRSFSCNFSCLPILHLLEEHVEPPNKQFLSSRQVVSDSHPQCQFRVLQHCGDVWHDVALIHTDGQNLTESRQITETKHRVIMVCHTCPFLLTPMMPLVASCIAVTKMVSLEMRFM